MPSRDFRAKANDHLSAMKGIIINPRGIVVLLAAMLLSLPTIAQQDSDFGIWMTAELKKKICKSLSAEAEAELRTRDGLGDVERWSLGAGLNYSIIKPLKIDAGYTFLRTQTDDELTAKGNIIPSYWLSRHRFYASLTAKVKVACLSLSLRERYQLTHRDSTQVAKYKVNKSEWTTEDISEKNKSILRSRLQVELKLKESNFTPQASVEFYNDLKESFQIDKTRLTIGTEYKINKHNAFEVYYRFIRPKDHDDDKRHIIGIAYAFKF